MSTPTRQVVMCMTDSTRWDMLGCYRASGLRTPNLDRMSEGGLRFERAYTCQPVCSPARSALFTGVWPHLNGVWANGLPLGANVRTVAEHLGRHGVQSAYIGKWHLDGTDYFGNGMAAAGWDPDYWYDGRRYLEDLPDDERRASRSRSTSFDRNLSADWTFAHRCSDRAIDFLRSHVGESFLLVVSYDEPHGPSICPHPYNSMYENFEWPATSNLADEVRMLPSHQQIWARHAGDPMAGRSRVDPLFLGAQSFVDAEIGRVFDAIREHTPQALVLYTSDHGEFLGAHGLTGKGPAAYDEIARVPLLMSWPGVIEPGRVWPEPVSHIDLAPTILEALGCPIPPSLSGVSVLDVLRDENPSSSKYVFLEFGRYEVDHDGFGAFQPLRAVTDGRYKLVINLLSDDELYDLREDPGERNNLILSAETSTVRDQLHGTLLAWMYDTRDPFRGYYWEHRPWRLGLEAPQWRDRGMTRQREEDGFEPRQLDYESGLEMTEAVREKKG